MDIKFTKGEWKINPRASRNVQCNGTTIANCSAGQSGDDEHIEIANAKLIACAPEILEMLIKLNNFCTMKVEDRNELEELIKKATEL